MNHALAQHCFTQCIDQRPEPHAGLSYPLGQDRASNFQPGAAKDFRLPVQRQVIGKLGHHDVGQQACGRNTFVDNLRRHRRLDQCFALTAGPFATHMLLDVKHAWRVIQQAALRQTDLLAAWSRLGEEVMPLIVPEQILSGDQQIGQKVGA